MILYEAMGCIESGFQICISSETGIFLFLGLSMNETSNVFAFGVLLSYSWFWIRITRFGLKKNYNLLIEKSKFIFNPT